MTPIYFIGGSPCSGKSTVAEILSSRYDLYYFKVDDYLEKYTQTGASKGYNICTKQTRMTPDQIWMRDPVIQCTEEFDFYEEISEFLFEDLKAIENKPVITEGAAYLPDLMKKLNIPSDRYVSITPTEDFQISHYKQRPWVPYVLGECSDKETAFSNWMKRDILFGEEVRDQCLRNHYVSIINDGNIEVEELVRMLSGQFGLGG